MFMRDGPARGRRGQANNRHGAGWNNIGEKDNASHFVGPWRGYVGHQADILDDGNIRSSMGARSIVTGFWSRYRLAEGRAGNRDRDGENF